MKKLLKGIGITLGAIAFAIGTKFIQPNQSAVKADPEPQYQFIEQTDAIDVHQTAYNAVVALAANNYAIETGDYLAIDFEGYNTWTAFKFGINDAVVGNGTQGEGVFLPVQSQQAGWSVEIKWGYWSFANDGRGIVYIPLSEYFPSDTNIAMVQLYLSDNKNEDVTFHNIFVTKDTTARNGTAILDCFDAQGALDSTKVTLVDATASARKSARGFQTNKSLYGSPVIAAPKTHIEITVDEGIIADGGYFAYDMSYNGEWVYFRTAYTNTTDGSFSDDYNALGKSLSKHGTLAYDRLKTMYEWYWCTWNTTGTALEKAFLSTGELSKIVLDCDNLCGGAQLVLGNFYYISANQKTVTPLVDFATMGDDEFASRVSVTINGEAASVTRAPKEMKVFYLADSISEGAKATTDGYDFALNPVMRNGQQVKFNIESNEIGLYETTIDYIAHVPWEIINIDGTEVHNGTMENNEVVVKGETAFSSAYAYNDIAAVLAFLDAGVAKVGFNANNYEDLVAVAALYNALSADVKGLVDICSAYDPAIFNLSEKAVVEVEHSQYTRTGSAIEPNVSVKLGEHVLSADTEYDIAFSNNVAVGTALVNVTFKGIFNGSASAQFSIVPIKYTVTFSAGEGSGTMAPVEHDEGDYALPVCTFTAPEGKMFDGWQVAGEKKLENDVIQLTGDITITALWKNIPVTTYTVSFNANGGSGTMAAVPGQSGDYALPANGFTAPEGYEFAGWKVNGVGDLLQPGAHITITADVELVAQWQEIQVITYTVSFNANGGEGTMAPVEKDENAVYVLPANGFTAPAGKQFAGWKVNGVGDLLQPGANIIVSADVELVAQWASIMHTISFAANGGSGTMAAIEKEENSTYALPACTFTAPDGKRFAGWKVGNEEAIRAVGYEITITGDVTITAQWENIPPATYTITFDANGGEGTMAPVEKQENALLTLPECEFTAPAGKEFAGWKISGEFSLKQPGDQIAIHGNITISAYWTDVTPVDPEPEVEPQPEPEQPAKKGCGSSVIAASALVSAVSLLGVALISIKKKH